MNRRQALVTGGNRTLPRLFQVGKEEAFGACENLPTSALQE
jgi:hypothetical protein